MPGPTGQQQQEGEEGIRSNSSNRVSKVCNRSSSNQHVADRAFAGGAVPSVPKGCPEQLTHSLPAASPTVCCPSCLYCQLWSRVRGTVCSPILQAGHSPSLSCVPTGPTCIRFSVMVSSAEVACNPMNTTVKE